MATATELSVRPRKRFLVSALFVRWVSERALITVAYDYIPAGLCLLHFGVQINAQNPSAHIDFVNRRQVENLEEKWVADESSKHRWYLAEQMV
jgi:hypothetical protein